MSQRSESTHYTPIPLVTLDAGNPTASAIIKTRDRRGGSLTWTWTSTLVAGLVLELSDNYDDRRPSEARWIQVSDPAILALLTTDYTTPTAGNGKPAGTAGAASLQLDPIQAVAIRFTATRTASSGTFVLDAKLQ